MVKKTYNPFKMWGTYAGGGIGLLLTIGYLFVLFNLADGLRDNLFNLVVVSSMVAVLFVAIFGIIGYMVHITIRAIKN